MTQETLEVGMAVRLRTQFKASPVPATIEDAPTYPNTEPTTVSLTVEDPAGVETTPSVTHVGTGYCHAVFVPTQHGLHRFRWIGTGAVVTTKDGTFTVERPLV